MKPTTGIFVTIAAMVLTVCGCHKAASSHVGPQPRDTPASDNQKEDLILVAVVKADITDHVHSLLSSAGIEAKLEQAGESARSKKSFQPPPGSWCVLVAPAEKSKATQLLYKDFHVYLGQGEYLWAMPPF